MKKIKIVFQGDSITDAGRDFRNYHDVSKGYPKYAAELITAGMPDAEVEFINQGIGGNRTSQLFDRFYKDAIEFQPDVISILIGINDVWHRYNQHIATTDEQIILNYREILKRIKRETNAKIVMLEPYILDTEPFAEIREDLDRLLPKIKALADEYADAYIPLHELFGEAMKTQPEPKYYSKDGVHPNDNGAEFIGKHYAEAVLPILKSL